MRYKQGSELEVGDTISVWWKGRRDTITHLTPYTGPLSGLFPSGARIAEFALLRVGMTIDNEDRYEIIT
jgi:hypothetical protein